MAASKQLAWLAGRVLLCTCLVSALCHTALATEAAATSEPHVLGSDKVVSDYLKVVGTPTKEVIYTTFSAYSGGVLGALRNFMYHLHKVGRFNNTMLITQDKGSCEKTLAVGIPCFLDEASPRPWDFPETHRYSKRPFDYGKIWWALKFTELGYTALYLDSDVAVLQDPLAPQWVAAPYDVQGLSDFRDAELPHVGELLTKRCNLYSLKQDPDVPGGDVYHPSFEVKEGEVALRSMAPCQSLGIYYVQPTPVTVAFLKYLADWIRHSHPRQWDQAAWNEVLAGFVLGMGQEAPLRFRILPVENFANIEVWEQRKTAKMAVAPVILHAGYLNGGAKVDKFKAINLWQGDTWSPNQTGMLHYRTHCTDGSSCSGGSGMVSLLALGFSIAIAALAYTMLRKRRRWFGGMML